MMISNNRRARVGYDDLREWMLEAERLGELVRASGYSWQKDIGMAAELLQHDARAPAALFDHRNDPILLGCPPQRPPRSRRAIAA